MHTKNLIYFFPLFFFLSFTAFSEEFLSTQLDDHHDEMSWWPWEEDDKEDEKTKKYNLKDVLGLSSRLKQKIIGQDEAVDITSEAIERYASGLQDPNLPVATLLYIGPTGVGKTELAKELSNDLLGSTQPLVYINMSEYTTRWEVTRLIGSSIGYMGSDKGGVLTNPLLANPYSIVVLDEFDKACPEIQKLFLGIFDEGVITSGIGQKVDCKNAVFIVTSNFCAAEILYLSHQGLETSEILESIEHKLMQAISPELYNRLTPVIFQKLASETFDKIVVKLLDELKVRIFNTQQITIKYDSTLVEYLTINGYSELLGARPLKRLIQKELVTFLSRQILKGVIQKGDEATISIRGGQLLVSITARKEATGS